MTVDVCEGYLRVWHRRPATDLAELHTVLSAIDEDLAREQLACVLFDSRESKYQAGEVQTEMWRWLTEHKMLRKVATVVESEMLAASVTMTGLSKGVKIKAFHDEATAATWLRR